MSTHSPAKKFKIGILGAGQLGCFLAKNCQDRNFDNDQFNWCLFFESEEDPGANLYKKNAIKIQIDPIKRKKQLEKCEWIILESEFYSYDELKEINAQFLPSIENYKHFYGKINQRKFYQHLGLISPKFKIISDVDDLDNVDFFPVILKKNLLSYDGKGNRECHNLHELHQFAMELGLPLLVEEKLEIKSEFAIGIVSNRTQWIELPITETFQKNHICHFVIGPHQLPKDIEQQLHIEIEKLKKAELIGLFAFEFFITKDNKLLINEGAARPHNSQHLTQTLCDHSQFDYLIDLALEIPIIPVKIIAPLGAMINLLGKKETIDPKLSLPSIPDQYTKEVYLYGKKQGRIGRKLGHLNILGIDQNIENFKVLLESIYQGYEL